MNAASAILGWGVLIIREGDISEHESVNVLYVLILLLRTVEIAKDTVPLVRRDHNAVHNPD